MNETQLLKELQNLNITLTGEQIKNLNLYCDFLLQENQITNLTAIRDKENVFLKHIYDSLTLVTALNLKNEKLYFENQNQEISNLLDIGTGPGFPGIIMKICFPYLDVTLLDSNRKKTNFLKKVCQNLNLENVTIITDRAENFINNNREIFDLVTTRAVAKLNVIMELSIPFVKQKGYFIAMKGIEDLQEKQDGLFAAIKLKCEIDSIKKFKLPIENSDRTLYVIRKKGLTPKEYPRRYEQIKKKPITN